MAECTVGRSTLCEILGWATCQRLPGRHIGEPEAEQAERLAVGKEKVQSPLMVVSSTHFLSVWPSSPMQTLLLSLSSLCQLLSSLPPA